MIKILIFLVLNVIDKSAKIQQMGGRTFEMFDPSCDEMKAEQTKKVQSFKPEIFYRIK